MQSEKAETNRLSLLVIFSTLCHPLQAIGFRGFAAEFTENLVEIANITVADFVADILNAVIAR